MNEKVLVIGSSGMAGHMIYNYLKISGVRVFGIDVCDSLFVDFCLDLMDIYSFRRFLKNAQYDYVINCAGIVGKSFSDNMNISNYINSELTDILLECLPESTKIVHISTDYVFSGRKTEKYNYNDIPDNETLYGKQKIKAEKTSPNFLNLRLSIIGPSLDCKKESFFNNLFNKKQLVGFSKMKTTLVSTLELAKYIKKIIVSNDFDSGVVNFASPRKTSKYDVMVRIKKEFMLHTVILKDDGPNLDYSLESNVLVPSLIVQLHELKMFMKRYLYLYKEYFKNEGK